MPRKPQGTKRRKRDPERPKRAMTAYMVYVRDNIKSVTRDMGNAKRSEVIRECGARWNRMTVTQKKNTSKFRKKTKIVMPGKWKITLLKHQLMSQN